MSILNHLYEAFFIWTMILISPTPSGGGDFIITEGSDPIISEGGDNLIIE